MITGLPVSQMEPVVRAIVLFIFGTNYAIAAASSKAALTAHACEGEELRLVCGLGHVIHIERANYGRYSTHVCNQHGELWATSQCQFAGSTEIVQRRCDGRSECRVLAVDDDFKDNCPDTFKYLAVVWHCQEMDRASTAVTKSRNDDSLKTAKPFHAHRSTASPDPMSSPAPTSAPVLFERISTPDLFQRSFIPARISVQKYKFCEEMEIRDVFLPKTRSGFDAKVPCPNSEPGEGYAVQRCNLDGTWDPGRPNLSRCVSRVFRSVQRDLKNAQGEDDIKRLLHSVKKETRFSRLYGGDTLAASRLALDLVDRSFAIAGRLSAAEKTFFASEVNQIVVELASNLLNDHQRESWADLAPNQRRLAAVDLLDSTVRSGRLVVRCMTYSSGTYTEKASNIFLEVSSVTTQSLSQVPSMSHYAPSMDNVQIPAGTLHMASIYKTDIGFARVVFVTYDKKMGEMLVPVNTEVVIAHRQITHVTRQVVSQIVAVVVDSEQPVIELSEAVIVTLAVDMSNNMSHPQCVYWERLSETGGGWAAKGSELMRQNRTHVVCAFDRLAYFAVLMDINSREGESFIDHTSLALIYGGCLISVVCLICILLMLNSRIRKRLSHCIPRMDWFSVSHLADYRFRDSLGYRSSSQDSRKLSSTLLAHSSGSSALKDDSCLSSSYYASTTHISHLYTARCCETKRSSQQSSCPFTMSEPGFGGSSEKSILRASSQCPCEDSVKDSIGICQASKVTLIPNSYYCTSDVSCGQDSGRGSLEVGCGLPSTPCPPPFSPPSPPPLEPLSCTLCCHCQFPSPNVCQIHKSVANSNNAICHGIGNNYIDARTIVYNHDADRRQSCAMSAFPSCEHELMYRLQRSNQSICDLGAPGCLHDISLRTLHATPFLACSVICHKTSESLLRHCNLGELSDHIYLTPNSSSNRFSESAVYFPANSTSSICCCRTLPNCSYNVAAGNVQPLQHTLAHRSGMHAKQISANLGDYNPS